MEFRDINPYEYLSLNGYLISVPIHVKHAFILSSLLYINLTGTLGLHDDLVGVMATFGGLCYYPLMIVALNRQPYKQILAGIFTIFQGILTAMLVIAGFIGLLRVFLYTCQADLGEICQLSAFDDFLRILGAWMFATLFAALTYFHYLYYEYLGFEEQRNRPEVGNVTPQENPFATIPFSNGYFPVAKASKWMCLACFNIFFNSYLLKYILFPSRKWWLFKIPLVFGLFHFVIYKIRTMKRVEKYRIAIIANFVYFLVVYSMAMALYGFINFIIALTYHSSARGLIALGCFVSVVFFAFCAFFFYYYGMFLDFEKKYNSVQAENVPKDPSDEGEAGRSGEESHETDRNGESNHANSKMKYCQLVVGPAGSGKSTYCATIQNHCQNIGRTVHVVNLDPAAEVFNYRCAVDVRDLVSVQDVQEDEELILGPNGSLVFCMEYLVEHLDWLHEALDEGEDDYFIFDCPGQIELYSHLPVMRQLVDALKSWDFNVCATFLLDTHFILEAEKFLSGALTTLSTMVALEVQSVNVLTKFDMLNEQNKALVESFLEMDSQAIMDQEPANSWNARHRQLTETIAGVLEDYSLVKFVPLDIEDEESITDLLLIIDNTIQYGEDLEVRDRYPEEFDDGDA